MDTLYKALNVDGTSCNRGYGQWNLPTRNEDGTWAHGEWMPDIIGALVPCKNGYHACTLNWLVLHLGPAIYELEYKGEYLDCRDKVVLRQARLLRRLNWDEQIARLFACDCAEKVLPLFEAKYPNDKRPYQCIMTARHYAGGTATKEELDAVWAAADAAAVDVTRAETWTSAEAAARAAVWAATGDGIWTAIWDAAWATRIAVWLAAEADTRVIAGATIRQWQSERLLYYMEW